MRTPLREASRIWQRMLYLYRLLRSSSQPVPPATQPPSPQDSPLPIPKLIWITSPSSAKFFALLCDHLFPRLNPTVMEHRFPPVAVGPAGKGGPAAISPLHRNLSYPGGTGHYFLSSWTALRRVVWAGPLLVNKASRPTVRDPGSPIYTAWNLRALAPDDRRPFEVSVDLAYMEKRACGIWWANEMKLGTMLALAGVVRETARGMDLTARLIVSEEDEERIRTEVEILERWMRDLVVVEVA